MCRQLILVMPSSKGLKYITKIGQLIDKIKQDRFVELVAGTKPMITLDLNIFYAGMSSVSTLAGVRALLLLDTTQCPVCFLAPPMQRRPRIRQHVVDATVINLFRLTFQESDGETSAANPIFTHAALCVTGALVPRTYVSGAPTSNYRTEVRSKRHRDGDL